MSKKVIILLIMIFITGLSLTTINLYGLTQDMRPSIFFNDELRFKKDDITLTREETFEQIKRKNNENDIDFASRISKVIASGMAHIHWEDYDNTKFNQLIPIWENYFIYFLGVVTNIPEYNRYHFSDYRRSLNRGIGICGDASMIMSQILNEHGINNQLITYPGHVVLAAKFDNGKELTFDPDFGVPLGFSPSEVRMNHDLVSEKYYQAGYTLIDKAVMTRVYNNDYQRWNGVKHFITKKYYFEKISYWLKWPFPIILMVISIYFYKRHRRTFKN